MSKSKIENRLNTMRHKQAQPTDSLILAESAEGKDFSQELSKAQPFDEIPSLTEKQVAFGMCNPQVFFFVIRRTLRSTLFPRAAIF